MKAIRFVPAHYIVLALALVANVLPSVIPTLAPTTAPVWTLVLVIDTSVLGLLAHLSPSVLTNLPPAANYTAAHAALSASAIVANIAPFLSAAFPSLSHYTPAIEHGAALLLGVLAHTVPAVGNPPPPAAAGSTAPPAPTR